MDDARKIRFLYPPLVVFFYVGWAMYRDEECRTAFGSFVAKHLQDVEPLVGAVAAAASGLVILGFVLGTFTYVALRAGFLICCPQGTRNHEAAFTSTEQQQVWDAVLGDARFDSADLFLAAVWVDFVLVPKEIHEWIMRRWNAFNVSLNTSVGLVIAALVVGFLTPIKAGCCWYVTGTIAALLFFLNALIARRDTMKMLVFAAKYRSPLKTHNQQ